MSPFLLVLDVAEHLNVSSDTVYREINRGALSAVRIGRQTRVSRDALNAYIKNRTTTNQLGHRRGAA